MRKSHTITTIHKAAQQAAQWVVDSVMGNGLAQHENEATGPADVTPGMPELARTAAAEGCVLLENDDVLPLDPDEEVAVFGRCQLDWFCMGYGSGGDVHPPYTSNLMDGLKRQGAAHNQVLSALYRDWCASEEHAAERGFWGHWPLSHPEMPLPRELVQGAAHTARTAIVVVGRSAGEDRDLPLEPGGYYLTDEEKDLLDTVSSCFERVAVVLNVANAIDLAWTRDLCRDGRVAILLAWQGGMEAGNAVADVLYGKTNPSGRLTCTFAQSYAAYPSSRSFGAKKLVPYGEGVFVGYRHFLTRAPEDVLYPFGYGLSYTSFALTTDHIDPHQLLTANEESTDAPNASLVVDVTVSNTGTRIGRDVVQLWCEPPQGRTQQPRKVLVAFAKTPEIAPGASQRLSLEFSPRELALFDEKRRAFVLEKGVYKLFANEVEAGHLELAEDLVLTEQLPRICSPSVDLRQRVLDGMPSEIARTRDDDVTFAQVLANEADVDDLVSQLSDKELEALTCGEGAMNSRTGAPGNAGALGGVTEELRARGIPPVVCADGPSGLRLQRRTSLLPCATALACTWDTALVQELYALLGQEARTAGIDMLLGPGMNLHRDPRCGRNFEYFGEDPLLTGRMAAAVVRGLQSQGVAACPKHFACNNQETRRNTSDSRLSERALRELYLRGFEICVREADPWALMTSYNKINGVWAHYNYDLATTVLREEWGYKGLVITDWWMRPARSPEFPKLRNNAYRVRAGVEVLMPGSMSHVLRIMERPRGVTRAELQRTARRVLALCKAVHSPTLHSPGENVPPLSVT